MSRARAGAVFAAVLGALMTGLVGSLFGAKTHADTGDYVVLGVVIAVGAVVSGVVLARSIGRRGKI